MATTENTWIMQGFENREDAIIKTVDELSSYINRVGFLPLFRNEVTGFSVEELTARDVWFGADQAIDPWAWREVIAERAQIAYAKLFAGKAGFISKEWYPTFVTYRRDAYDFDSRYEDGLASNRAKKVMDVLNEYESLPSNELKEIAGFGKGGEKGFDTVMSQLQMQTYVTVRRFKRKLNKKNEEYGWPVTIYSLPEKIWGEDLVRSEYSMNRTDAKDKIVKHFVDMNPQADCKAFVKILK
ncbi:MAG TPA: hypothetical protein VHQ24_04820 [Lachnospiraceae bacterium]|nr:hypothetical protein [Lachnospiraceae bacterium]